MINVQYKVETFQKTVFLLLPFFLKLFEEVVLKLFGLRIPLDLKTIEYPSE